MCSFSANGCNGCFEHWCQCGDGPCDARRSSCSLSLPPRILGAKAALCATCLTILRSKRCPGCLSCCLEGIFIYLYTYIDPPHCDLRRLTTQGAEQRRALSRNRALPQSAESVRRFRTGHRPRATQHGEKTNIDQLKFVMKVSSDSSGSKSQAL